jgi:hypothetical protein
LVRAGHERLFRGQHLGESAGAQSASFNTAPRIVIARNISRHKCSKHDNAILIKFLGTLRCILWKSRKALPGHRRDSCCSSLRRYMTKARRFKLNRQKDRDMVCLLESNTTWKAKLYENP